MSLAAGQVLQDLELHEHLVRKAGTAKEREKTTRPTHFFQRSLHGVDVFFESPFEGPGRRGAFRRAGGPR